MMGMEDAMEPGALLACYKGDELVGIKTAAEWAAERGMRLATVHWMA